MKDVEKRLSKLELSVLPIPGAEPVRMNINLSVDREFIAACIASKEERSVQKVKNWRMSNLPEVHVNGDCSNCKIDCTVRKEPLTQ